ncbi:MAG TPA: AraC family transcriptional regulator [Caulobacteraceae bacterium]|nr:AraC family transcriptional regulator [Caulobacteraceae bacterium]
MTAAALDDLRAIAARHAVPGRVETAVPRFGVATGWASARPLPSMYRPMICVVLQGAKEVTIGERRLRYDPGAYFVAALDLPARGCIVQTRPDEPYLGLILALDGDVLSSLITDTPARDEAAGAAFAVSPVTDDLLDPWLRMLRLLDAPADIPVLAPLIEREILYRVLQGPQGGVLRQAARADSRIAQVRRAIGFIRDHFDKPLRVEALADLAGMSAASFHRHFKAATAMSPLQYQKTLRLQQARQLLIARQDAARAGYAVGYESASQFSREYARLFGAPPARDAVRLRGDQAAGQALVAAP